MSKRPRRHRKGATSAEQIRLDELPPTVANSPAFQAFEARLEQALEMLVSRWSHVAAPVSLNVRRVMPLPIRRRTEPA
jgi:hypothetical protein